MKASPHNDMTTKRPNTQPAQPTPRQQYYEWIDALNDSSNMQLTGYGKETIVSAIEKFAGQAVARSKVVPLPKELDEVLTDDEMFNRATALTILDGEKVFPTALKELARAYIAQATPPSPAVRDADNLTLELWEACAHAEARSDGTGKGAREAGVAAMLPIVQRYLSAPLPAPVNTAHKLLQEVLASYTQEMKLVANGIIDDVLAWADERSERIEEHLLKAVTDRLEGFAIAFASSIEANKVTVNTALPAGSLPWQDIKTLHQNQKGHFLVIFPFGDIQTAWWYKDTLVYGIDGDHMRECYAPDENGEFGEDWPTHWMLITPPSAALTQPVNTGPSAEEAAREIKQLYNLKTPLARMCADDADAAAIIQRAIDSAAPKVGDVERLREALEDVMFLQKAPGEDATTALERYAEQFTKETGMMAPFKSQSPYDNSHTEKERSEGYQRWIDGRIAKGFAALAPGADKGGA